MEMIKHLNKQIKELEKELEDWDENHDGACPTWAEECDIIQQIRFHQELIIEVQENENKRLQGLLDKLGKFIEDGTINIK